MQIMQSEVFPFYRECTYKLNEVYEYIKTKYSSGVDELCKLRGYIGQEQKACLEEFNIGAPSESGVALEEYPDYLGLLSNSGNFLLNERYVIPVYDMGDNLCSLIGYYPDSRKYITLPTPFFAKTCQFFNFRRAYERSWSEFGGFVILVEGIFDCLSIDAIGLPCIATMGSTVTEIKGELLKLFSKVLGVPDDDTTGRRALNRYAKGGWKVPDNTVMLKFIGGTFDCGGTELHCKDLDNFVSWYEKDDVVDILLSYRDSNKEVDELIL